jgi:predicted nuclease of predicted toxin-antitoxin system
MKIKLDENLPFRLVNILADLGHETDTVPEEGLAGHGDSEIWEAVQNEGYFFITQDLDFSDTRRFIPGTHNGLLLIRLRAPGRKALLERIQYLFKNENVARWKGCFVLVTEHKIRVKYPTK